MRKYLYIALGLLLLPIVTHAAPIETYQPSLLPLTTDSYYLGSSTPSLDEWLGLFVKNLTVSGTCTGCGGGGSGGSGTVSTSTIPTIGQLAYWTSGGYPSLLGSVATTSHSFSGPFSISGTTGALVGGTNSTVNWTGLSTTTNISSSNLLVSNGGAGVYGVATSTLTPSSPLTGSFTGLGGTLGIQAASASQNGYQSSANYQLTTTATTTFSAPLVYTLSTNAVTCTNASNGVTGCMSAADWGLLHTATSTFSAPLSYTLSTNAVTCPTCLTANQTITLSGAVSGSGATSIATTFDYTPWGGSIISTNYATTSIASTTMASFIEGLAASSTSYFVEASTTNLSATQNVYANNFYDSSTNGNSCIGDTGTLLENGNCVSSITSNGSTLNVSSATGNVNLDLNLNHSNWWAATQNFTNATSSGFEATSTNVFFDGPAAGSLLATNGNKQLVGTSTIGDNLIQTNVSAGSCTNCNLTYNANGFITAAANGSAGTASSTLLIDNNTFSGTTVFSVAGTTTITNGISFKALSLNGTIISSVASPLTTTRGQLGCTTCNTTNASVSSVASASGILGGTITTTGTLSLQNWIGTSTADTLGYIAYSGTTNGWPAKLSYAATSSLSGGGPITVSNSPFIIGASTATLGCTNASNGVTGCMSATDWGLLHTATTTFAAPLNYTVSTNQVVCATAAAATAGCLSAAGGSLLYTATTTFGSGLTYSVTTNQATFTGLESTTTSPFMAMYFVATSSTATNVFMGPIQIGTTTDSDQLFGTSTLLEIGTSTNNFTQAIISNNCIGPVCSDASADWVTNNASSTNSAYYADFGLNGPSFSNSLFSGEAANDAFMTASDGNFDIEAASSTANVGINFLTGGTLSSNIAAEIKHSGLFTIGTTTPAWGQLTLASSTASQLTLSDTASADAGWSFRAAGNNFYIASTTQTSTSTALLEFSGAGYTFLGTDGFVAVGATSTPGSIFSLGNIANFLVGTSTFYSDLQMNGAQFATNYGSTTATASINATQWLINWNTGNTQRILATTTTGLVINSTSSNPIDGGKYILKVCNTGGSPVSFVTPGQLAWANGTTTITTTANTATMIGMIYDARSGLYDVVASSTITDTRSCL